MDPVRIIRGSGAVALLALGALVLHQLRYLLAHGGGAGDVLAATGHGYLELAVPLVAAVAVAAVIVSVVAPALLRRSAAAPAEWGPTERAAGYAAALLAVHLAQEGVEGALAAGHAGGAALALGGGSFAVPALAIALGAIGSFARGWLRRAEVRLAAALDRGALPRPPARSDPTRRPAPRPPLSSLPLRFGLARRPPPLPAGA